ncbi:hypothetical protein N7481_012060 [Penicillium waksmanii]|uniref:uncharacterized protein n=1 Tax=Penicillium waksmanii TaxID=69791 RepID=UPI002546F2D9|nr:uncharacterized protein N7481_012060 [Penicillium waksmanii]KAJ5965346.1 hypothetical protein N7481_012060 [Penicillium waksmanii]
MYGSKDQPIVGRSRTDHYLNCEVCPAWLPVPGGKVHQGYPVETSDHWESITPGLSVRALVIESTEQTSKPRFVAL